MTATNVRDKSSTKGNSATTPHDCDAETNLQKDPRKRSASYDGNTGDKSHKWLNAEGDGDKNKDAGTNEAPGDDECLTATDGRNTSSTKGDGATMPHDCDTETNLQKDADTHSSTEGDDDKNKNACTNEAPGDGKHLTATNSCDTSSTQKRRNNAT